MSADRSKLHHLVPAPWGNSPDGERSQAAMPRRARPKNASRACNECQKRKIKVRTAFEFLLFVGFFCLWDEEVPMD